MEEPDKRYLLFGNDQFYPSGGLGDLRGSFDSVEDALIFKKSDDREYYELYDRIEGVEIEIDPNN